MIFYIAEARPQSNINSASYIFKQLIILLTKETIVWIDKQHDGAKYQVHYLLESFAVMLHGQLDVCTGNHDIDLDQESLPSWSW